MSMQTNQTSLLPFPSPRSNDRLIKLRDVEHILEEYFHRDSRPSRSTIIGWIEDGTLNGTQLGRGRNYYVYELSLDSFKSKLAAQNYEMAA